MATTVRSGAIYSIGVYGVARYGKSNVVYTPDGVSATATRGNVSIVAKATTSVIGVVATGNIGSVSVVGKATILPTGVSATGSVGTNFTFSLVCRFTPTGVSSTGSVGNIVVLAKANTSIIGYGVISSLGIVEVKAQSVFVTTGVFATGNVGSVSIFENAQPIFSGVSAIGSVGGVTITTVVFNYNAVAALYDKNRTVFVGAKSTAKERTVMVMKDNRIVYIEGRSTTATRTANVDEFPRRVYTYRKPSSSDRSVLVT